MDESNKQLSITLLPRSCWHGFLITRSKAKTVSCIETGSLFEKQLPLGALEIINSSGYLIASVSFKIPSQPAN